MKSWQPTQAQTRAWEEKGYFTVPGVATADQAAEMRGVIKNILYTPEPENVRTDATPWTRWAIRPRRGHSAFASSTAGATLRR